MAETAGRAAEDSWAQAESALSLHLREHPDVERALLHSSLESLNGADLFLRASVVEERLGFEAARLAYELADERVYSEDVRRAREEMLDRVVDLVRGGDGRVVDVATGRGTLLERLLRATERPLVATDVSATVLSRVRARLGTKGVEYVVADTRELPFEDGSVPTLASHLGLANVPDAGPLLRELRRVGHKLVTTHLFYPDDDEENLAAAREHGLGELLSRTAALAAFAAAGWKVEVELEREVPVEPTPASELIPGVRIDALPVAPTRATWCVLVAR
jgi:ubiquinone/menaquinone biosynthesis C-methylase UbiE